MVTPMLPHAGAVNAGALVMHARLTALSRRHELTLATLAGPDPAEWRALEALRAARIDTRAVWRPEPSPFLRRWRRLAPLAGPDPSTWTGGEIRVEAADRRGVVVPRETAFRRWKRRSRLAGFWLRGKYPLRALQFWEPEMQSLLDRLCSEESFDLIQVEDDAMGSYGYRTQAPVVLAEYDVMSPPPDQQRGGTQPGPIQRALSAADGRRWRAYQPRVWRRFDRVQVFTPRDASAVGALAPDVAARVRVNPFGVELPAESDPVREEAGTVAFVGGFFHPPNVDAALWLGKEIMPLLRARRPGVRLLIVGSHPPEAVRALAGEDTLVTGRVPAVEPFVERAAVVLAPVRSGGGMRLKVLQAMAAGKAVVTTPIGAEGLAAAGSPPPLAIAADAEGLAAATAALLESEADRRALGRRARAFVAEHHTWSAHRRRMEATYAELQPLEPLRESHREEEMARSPSRGARSG